MGLTPLKQSDGSFLVFPGGDCVPIDGPLRVAELSDGWYVIGENSTAACGSERAARATLHQLLHERNPHLLAQQAMDRVDPADTDVEC